MLNMDLRRYFEIQDGGLWLNKVGIFGKRQTCKCVISLFLEQWLNSNHVKSHNTHIFNVGIFKILNIIIQRHIDIPIGFCIHKIIDSFFLSYRLAELFLTGKTLLYHDLNCFSYDIIEIIMNFWLSLLNLNCELRITLLCSFYSYYHKSSKYAVTICNLP